jgi:hypothetical protein
LRPRVPGAGVDSASDQAVNVANLLSRVAKLLVAIALLQICGGHWGLLQGVAWAGMFVSYASREASLPDAIEKTFSGDNPCKLCVAVQEGRGMEKKNEVMKTLVKLEAVLSPVRVLPVPEEEHCKYAPVDEAAEQIAFPPISPPPLIG